MLILSSDKQPREHMSTHNILVLSTKKLSCLLNRGQAKDINTEVYENKVFSKSSVWMQFKRSTGNQICLMLMCLG